MILNVIKEIKSQGGISSAIFSLFGKDNTSIIDEFNKLIKSGESLTDTINFLGIKDEKLKQVLIDASAAANGGAINFEKLDETQQKVIKTTGLQTLKTKALSLGITFLVTAAISLAIKAWNDYKKSLEDAKNEAEELQNALKTTDDSVKRIKELKDQLADSNLTEQESTSIKQELLDIQNQLIETYGEEANQLNLVNGEYESQLNKIRELNAEKQKAWLTENYTAFNAAESNMKREREYVLTPSIDGSSELGKELEKLLNGTLKDYGFEKSGELYEGASFRIKFVGDVTEAEEAINKFRQEVSNIQQNIDTSGDTNIIINDIIKSTSDAYNKAQDILDTHQANYRQGLISKMFEDADVYGDGKSPADLMMDYSEAVEKYNNALKTSDSQEDISSAKHELEAIQILVNQCIGDNQQYAYVFNEIANAIAETSAKYNTFSQLLSNPADNIQEALNEIKELGLNSTDLRAINLEDGISENGEKSWKVLTILANAYGVSIDDLIAKLIELGYVQGEINNKPETASLFSSFEGSEIGSRLQYLTTKFKEGALSHKEYFEALQNEINDVNFAPYTNSIEEASAAMQQFFTDSVQQTASGLSGLINKFDSGGMSITEYLEGYLSIANTLNTLTDSLQENSSEWSNNGEAIGNATSNALDNAQSSLNSAISIIETYQDSIYSIEVILGGTLEAGSDDFKAHANVVAQDLASIVANGGEMSDEVATYLGTTTEEIAKSMTENVDNQSVAAQAIAANTNVAISNMATAIGDLFVNIGNAISNFKVDISFGIKSISTEAVDMGILGVHNLPKINFALEANGDSLATIGAAVSSFGETISANIATQQIELPDFNITSENEYDPDPSTLKNYNKELDRLSKASGGAANATDNLKKSLEDIKGEYDDLLAAINWFYDEQIDAIDKKIDKLNEENEALEKQKENLDLILALVDSTYQDEIDALQEKINAMDEANDEAERELALEKARLALTEARRKRVMLYEKGKGFVYQEDPRAVKEAENELAELEAEASAEKLKKSIQDQIDKLEEFRDMWSAIPDAAEKAMQEAAMIAKYGANWKELILSNDPSILDDFQGEYTGIQNDISHNESLIEQLEKQKSALEDMKSMWEDVTKTYEESQYRMKLAAFFGSDYEKKLLNDSTKYQQKFASEYANIMAQIEALEKGGTITGVAANATEASGAVQQLNDDLTTVTQNKGNVNAATTTVVNDVSGTIEAAKQNIGLLQDALNTLETTKQTIEENVDQNVVDVDTLISDTSSKVEAIMQIISPLEDIITSLTRAMQLLVGAMQTLNGDVLTGVIGKVGFIDDESGTQSLFGAIQSVITKIGDLVLAISALDQSQLDAIIAEFGLGGEEGGESLLSAIQAVSTAVGSEGDENPDSLYTHIMNLVNTITTITTVKDNFTDLTSEVAKAVTKVKQLDEKIRSLPDKKTIDIYVNVHGAGSIPSLATGTAWTGKGFATGSAKSGNAYMSGNWGLPTDEKDAIVGELGKELAVFPNGTYKVFDRMQMTDLPKGTIIFNHEQTRAILNRGRSSNIDRLQKLGYKKIEGLSGNAFASGTANGKLLNLLMNGLPGMGGNLLTALPSRQYSSYIPNIGEQGRNIEVNIGDVILHGVQNPEGMADAIIKRVGNVFTQKLSK